MSSVVVPPGGGRPNRPMVLVAAGGIAVLALIVGVAVWIARDDEPSAAPASTTPSTTVVASTTDPATPVTTAPSTVPPETTVPATTSTTTSTVPAPTTAQPTVPTTTLPEPPSGETWTITPLRLSTGPLTLAKVAEVDGAAAYEGTVDIGEAGLRCIVIAFDDSWKELCTSPDRTTRFVAMDDIDPWLIEVGTDPGDIAMTRRPPAWTLPSNGCDQPLGSILPREDLGGSVLMSIRCVGGDTIPGDATMSFAHALLGPGPPDGLTVVVAEGDEGWNTVDLGTEITCESSDGVDRCALYGVEQYLWGGFPIPPANLSPATGDIIAVRDDTSAIRALVGDASTTEDIEAALLAGLVDPDTEVPATTQRLDDQLVVVEVPLMDDSILSDTWAVWIDPTGDQNIVLAMAWSTCARGIAGPDLCV